MFIREDNTFNQIRERSLQQWLADMEQHEDISVRGGVKLCREYIEYLEKKNSDLKKENELKNQYLRRMAEKKRR